MASHLDCTRLFYLCPSAYRLFVRLCANKATTKSVSVRVFAAHRANLQSGCNHFAKSSTLDWRVNWRCTIEPAWSSTPPQASAQSANPLDKPKI